MGVPVAHAIIGPDGRQRRPFALIERGAPSDVAVAAPGRHALTYAGLRCQVRHVADRLAQLGCRPDHRIAMVLPNGPEMAVAFLGTALRAAAAPLNPAFRRSEFECLLRELEPAALITSPQAGSALIEAADACGVAIFRVISEPDQSAGVFRRKARRSYRA